MNMQRCGEDEILAAIDNNENISLILVKRDSETAKLQNILEYAESSGIKIIFGSENDLWRMSRDNSQGIPNVLALVGRNPDLSLQEVFSNGGLVWLLAGAAYPVNIGFCIRTAEVSGASAVIVDAELNNPERSAAKRASMKAHRFIPVHWTPGLDAIKMAKKSGFRIIAVEDVGTSAPWDVDMTGDIILVVGGEKNGISSEILSESDEIVRIPMSGFVPSFNLQAPLSAVAIEAQRQRS
ncbi:MAG: RNA methyltransferase [Candidatus Thalassarchaeum sp.]|jgi:23S rRNA (guanosine2251-2'-O)-methyltransferase|nr:RNA methyltransferase [Candidatus Thalassarchaeum sp.]MCH1523627.1 RNA methyltransferase [Candidatus Thalassarchaeaceae archaeon]MDA7555928.1 RNA methyltransferase [Euryarchaeota archaeon]MDB3855257.1 RNA methyltransferase [Euryarchaeota archaeon]MDC0962609.1 RNA methyltransferase [Euryarchaeota archaeon]|tara:strand:- start:1082 stop:1798 length:717 start_codon:yes stop_codon:yes gene_type:complete